MIIIIGLGNPGEKFSHTRHNVGFEVLDFFANKKNFQEFTLSKKYNSLISAKSHAHILENVSMAETVDEKIILAKPQTFMNKSGTAAKKMIYDLRLKIYDLVVVRDDIDMPLGKIKFAQGSGAGGHKGVDSIIQHLGVKNFTQLKIGIKTDEKPAAKVVLKKFTKEEQKILHQVFEKSANALTRLIENGLEKAMNEYNR